MVVVVVYCTRTWWALYRLAFCSLLLRSSRLGDVYAGRAPRPLGRVTHALGCLVQLLTTGRAGRHPGLDCQCSPQDEGKPTRPKPDPIRLTFWWGMGQSFGPLEDASETPFEAEA